MSRNLIDKEFIDPRLMQEVETKIEAAKMSGPQGEKGDPGIQGIQGETGPAGSDANVGEHATVIASSDTLGHMKVGANLSIDGEGVLSADASEAYALTDGSVAKRPLSNDFNDLKDTGIYAIPNNVAINPPYGAGGLWSWFIYVVATPVDGFQNQISQIAEQGPWGLKQYRSFEWSTGVWGAWRPYASGLNNTLTSTSTVEAATANAVKQVNDKIMGDSWTPITSFGYLWSVDAAKGDFIQMRSFSNGIVQVRGLIRCTGTNHGSVPFNLSNGHLPKTSFAVAAVHDVLANDLPLATSLTMNLIVMGNGSVALTQPVPNMSGRRLWVNFDYTM